MSEALRNARTAVFVELLRAPSGAKELTDKGLSELSRSQNSKPKKATLLATEHGSKIKFVWLVEADSVFEANLIRS